MSITYESLAFYKTCISLDVVHDLLADLEANYTHAYFWSMILRKYIEAPLKLILGETYSLLNHGCLAYPKVKSGGWCTTSHSTCLICKSAYPSQSPYVFLIPECHKCCRYPDTIHLIESDDYRKFVLDLNNFIVKGYDYTSEPDFASAFS